VYGGELTLEVLYQSPQTTPGYTGPAGWFLYVQGPSGNGGYIGYYNASDFSGLLNKPGRANWFSVGGEISDPLATWSMPMGTGSAVNSQGSVAYHRNYQSCLGGYAGGYTTCTWGGYFQTSGNFGAPIVTVPGYADSTSGGQSGWGPYFFFGNNTAIFEDQDSGDRWTPIGDWSSGNAKGQCGYQSTVINSSYPTNVGSSPVFGLSKTGGDVPAHAVLCGAAVIHNVTGASCYSLTVNKSTGDKRNDTDSGSNFGGHGGDWDHNYIKGECRANEFVQGVAQTYTTPSYSGIQALLCCPGSVGHNSCEPQIFYSGDSPPVSANADWDPKYFKGQCQPGQYVAGVSMDGAGSPHGLLCCNP
jgi:hypothetical protein